MKTILTSLSLVGMCFFSSAQLASINENFDTFTVAAPFPQNGWSLNAPSTLMMSVNEDGSNRFIQSYAFTQVNVPHYLISPQIVAPDGTKTITFDVSKYTQSSFMGSIEVGLVTSPTDVSSFTSLGAAVTLQSTIVVTLSYNVPASSKQYIAFKFVGANMHASSRLDNVIYGVSNLSVADNIKNHEKLKFVASNHYLTFFGKARAEEIKIYSSSGRIVSSEKIMNNNVDISKLLTGIYFFQTLNNDGSVLNSRFIKK